MPTCGKPHQHMRRRHVSLEFLTILKRSGACLARTTPKMTSQLSRATMTQTRVVPSIHVFGRMFCPTSFNSALTERTTCYPRAVWGLTVMDAVVEVLVHLPLAKLATVPHNRHSSQDSTRFCMQRTWHMKITEIVARVTAATHRQRRSRARSATEH